MILKAVPNHPAKTIANVITTKATNNSIIVINDFGIPIMLGSVLIFLFESCSIFLISEIISLIIRNIIVNRAGKIGPGSVMTNFGSTANPPEITTIPAIKDRMIYFKSDAFFITISNNSINPDAITKAVNTYRFIDIEITNEIINNTIDRVMAVLIATEFLSAIFSDAVISDLLVII